LIKFKRSYDKQIKVNSFEVKYSVPVSACPKVLDWLKATMRPDPKYPRAIIHTLYYDTRNLSALREKVDSDYLKTKVRLRWYQTFDGKAQGEKVFAEVKYRIGKQRKKMRFDTSFSPDFIVQQSINAPELLTLNQLLVEQGVINEESYYPALQLEYERHRFIEPSTGARVCLDSAIYLKRTNPLLLAPSSGCKIPAAVFEYKHLDSQLPYHLATLFEFGAQKSSFSKYFACAENLYD